jgi:transcriptional regulator with XRE-family HTH domain
MKNIDDVFKSTILYFMNFHGSQKNFASSLGISPSFLNDIIKMRRKADEETKRQIAGALGYPDRQYEDFLDVGRHILDGGDPNELFKRDFTESTDDLKARGFMPVPYSDTMELDPVKLVIPTTLSEEMSPYIVHAPSLGKVSSINFQALLVWSDSMSPVLEEGDVVLIDKSENDPYVHKVDCPYVICQDIDRSRHCDIKIITWADKGKSILISSPKLYSTPLIIKKVKDIKFIGRVIWAWKRY